MIEQIKSIDEIAVFLKRNGEKLKPLSFSSIQTIEKKLGKKLPRQYVRFLEIMGDGAGFYMKGSSVFYNDLANLKQWADDLLKEHNLVPLSKDVFVFWMHQGYQLAFFDLESDDNPPVYFLFESESVEGLSKEMYPTLFDFLLTQLYFSYPELYPG